MVKARRRRREEGPMPMSGAGLIRFFEEDISGVRVRPELVVAIAIMFIVTIVLAHVAIH